MRNRKSIILAMLLAMGFVFVTPANAQLYEVIDLNAQYSNIRSARAMNNNGQVVGHLTGTQAYLWDNINGLQELGYLGGDFSIAEDISDNGKVVGLSTIADSPPGGCPPPYGCPYDPFLYEDGVMQDLGNFGGTTAQALGVNNQGQVAGWSYITGDAYRHAFLYRRGYAGFGQLWCR
jgi:probable HAF family extracellular repeat protein